jgi:hypothetical protein
MDSIATTSTHAGPTPGRDEATVLEQEANDAFAASNPTP